MSIEQDLRRALRRTPAPPGFAARVVARVEGRELSDSHPAPRHAARATSWWWLAGAAAALVMTAGSMHHLSSRRDAVEAERVRHDVDLALQITVQKLTLIQNKLQ